MNDMQPEENNHKNTTVYYMTRIFMPIFFTMLAIVGGITIYFLFVRKEHLIDLGKKIKTKDGLIAEYPEYKGGNYVFSQEQLESFEKYFLKTQYYGLELNEVNQIILGDRNVLAGDSGVSGLTVPQTKQVFINLEKVPLSLNYKDKVKSLMPIVSHEYGHFLTGTYFNNTNKVNASDEIYLGEGKDRNVEYWNQEYLSKFQSILHFKSKDKQTKDKHTNKISSIYSLGDLYNFANNKTEHKINRKDLVYQAPNTPGLLKISINLQGDGGNVYIYNQDELATREMQQLMYSHQMFNSDGTYNFIRPGTGDKPKTGFPKTGYWDAYMQDLLMTANFKKGDPNNKTPSPTILYPNYIWGGDYKTTSGVKTLNNVSKDYYEMLINGMGYGKQISKAWFKNDTYTLNGRTIQHSRNKNYINKDKIKWSGFISESTNADKIKVFDASGNSTMTININVAGYGEAGFKNTKKTDPAFNFFAKKEVNIQYNNDINNTSTVSRAENSDFWNPTDITNPDINSLFSKCKSYVTSDYVDAKALDKALGNGGQMFFYDGDKKLNQITKLNNFGQSQHSETPYVTTYPQGLVDNQSSDRYWTFIFNTKTGKIVLGDNYA